MITLVGLLLSGVLAANDGVRIQVVSDASYLLVSQKSNKTISDMYSKIKYSKRIYLMDDGLYIFGKEEKDSIYIYILRGQK
jgi:hypothetical protein